MEFKTFSKSFYPKLQRLLLFSILSFAFLSCNNTVKDESIEQVENKSKYTRKGVSFYDSGKPKEFNLFIEQDGKSVLVGYEELHENGAVKISGLFNSEGQRDGLWQSFYEDGTPWSIGELLNGEEVGQKRVWYANGKLRYEGMMKNGEPIGLWFFWSETGVKTEKVYK